MKQNHRQADTMTCLTCRYDNTIACEHPDNEVEEHYPATSVCDFHEYGEIKG